MIDWVQNIRVIWKIVESYGPFSTTTRQENVKHMKQYFLHDAFSCFICVSYLCGWLVQLESYPLQELLEKNMKDSIWSYPWRKLITIQTQRGCETWKNCIEK